MSDAENCTHDCGTCGENCSSREEAFDFSAKLHPLSSVEKVIGVVSGKGGVGKSLVTSLLAVAMQRRGHQTAVLDADITGPSIPKIFGIEGLVKTNEHGILPAVSKTGIDIISVNLLLPDRTEPVIWRGPALADVVRQFWSNVIWTAEDFMFVDMPPGTGDIPLTVFQSLPLAGIIIVSSPQELVADVVEKAIKMANQMNIPVLGIAENMSHVVCPDCGKEIAVFGKGKTEEIAAKYNIDFLAKIPFSMETATLCDMGEIENTKESWLDKAADKLEKLLQED